MEPTVAEIRRHPERAVIQQAADILAAGSVAHVGFVDGGRPVVIPFGYQFDAGEPDRLYLHGTPGGRAMDRLESGEPVCVTVTLLDGLVYSKTALYHSMNYRSVVCFGRGQRVTDRATQDRVFERMVSRYFAGRTIGRDYSAPTEAHLGATSLVEIQIEEWSAKRREGGPKGPTDHLPDEPGTCGVVPV